MPKIDSTLKRLFLDPKKRRAWVIYQLQLQGRTLASVAAEHGCKRQTLYAAFGKRYPAMEHRIAAALDLTPQELFPDRYDADGLPKRQRGGQRSGRKICCHGANATPDVAARNTRLKAAA